MAVGSRDDHARRKSAQTRPGRALTSLLLSLAAIWPALTADAAGARESRAARTEVTYAPREPGEPVMAIVSIKSQKVTFYDGDGWIFSAPVSTGVKGRETPAGVFAILEKDIDHHSSLYDDASMPHMQRLTWNGVALHGGPLPGYAASHGCVRMPYDFAEMLFDQTRIGMRVIVSPIDADPVEISHPSLFEPNADRVAAAPAMAERLEKEAAESVKVAEDTKKAAKVAARDAATANAEVRKLEKQKARAEADIKSAEKILAIAKSNQSTARAEEQKAKATAKASETAIQLEAAVSATMAKTEAATKATEAAKAAAEKKVELAKAANDAKLALEPVSVYISRSTQKVYVRRNTHKPWPDGGEVFDATIESPVTIKDPERPIGTHVFTAMVESGKGLRWSAVTIDDRDSANAALDRITIPKDILDRIAPTAVARSSIVISDEPLSRETNYRTEFVAVLSNQPQGGFITRKPTVNVEVSNNQWKGGFFNFFDGPAPVSASKTSRRRSSPPPMKNAWSW